MGDPRNVGWDASRSVSNPCWHGRPPLPTGSRRPAWNMPSTLSLYPYPSISVHIRPHPDGQRVGAPRGTNAAPPRALVVPGPGLCMAQKALPYEGWVCSINHAFRTPVSPTDISLPLSSTTVNLYQCSMGTLLWIDPQSSRPPDLTYPPGVVLKGPGRVPSTRSHTLMTQHRASRFSYLLQKHRFENRGNSI